MCSNTFAEVARAIMSFGKPLQVETCDVSITRAFAPFPGAQPDSLWHTVACLGQMPHVRSGSELDTPSNPGDGALTTLL